MWDVASLSLKMFIQLFFFLFLLSSYFRSIDSHVVSIVSGGCNQFSTVLFYVVFKPLVLIIQCWQILFLLFFSTHIVCRHHLCDVRPYASSLVFLFSGPLREWSQVSYKKHSPGFIPFRMFLLFSLVLSSFFVLLRNSFLIFSFISICLRMSASDIPKYLYISFSLSVLFFFFFLIW